MGNHQCKTTTEPSHEPSHTNKSSKFKIDALTKTKFEYQHAQNFIPLITSKTKTLVEGYIRMASIDGNINQIIPIDIIHIIYTYSRTSSTTFIIIFEHDTKPQNAYIHEIDIESNTNRNLSIKYDHTKIESSPSDIIWRSIIGASYCYGTYKNQDAIYRIANDTNSIACILRTREIINLPEIAGLHSTALYSKYHGLLVFGGSEEGIIGDRPTNNVCHLNEKTLIWERNLPPMTHSRYCHLALNYESMHYDISDKIFCFGGYGVQTSMEWFDFKQIKWHSRYCSDRSVYKSGGCIDYQTNTIVVGGGDYGNAHWSEVSDYDLEKNKWINYGNTNFPHRLYPGVAKSNGVIVIFGNKGSHECIDYRNYGYVEYYDTRSSDTRWIVLSSLREMLAFSGQEVKNRFYQHMIQL